MTIQAKSSRPAARVLGWISMGAVMLSAGCSKTTSSKSADDPVVVQIGSQTLRLHELQAALNRAPERLRVEYAAPAEQQKLASKLVDQEILAAEAERLGYANAPEVLAAKKRALAQKLLIERLGNGPQPGEVTEEAMRQYYADHPGEFGPPEKFRVAVLFVKDTDKARTAAADAVRAVAPDDNKRADQVRFDAFTDIVKRYTEEPNARDVVLSRLATGAYPPVVTDAALALREIGSLSPLIETANGFYMLQLKERTPGFTKPFAEVRQHAAQAVSEQIRDRKVSALVAEVAKKLEAKVAKEALAQLRFDGDPARQALSEPVKRFPH